MEYFQTKDSYTYVTRPCNMYISSRTTVLEIPQQTISRLVAMPHTADPGVHVHAGTKPAASIALTCTPPVNTSVAPLNPDLEPQRPFVNETERLGRDYREQPGTICCNSLFYTLCQSYVVLLLLTRLQVCGYRHGSTTYKALKKSTKNCNIHINIHTSLIEAGKTVI